MRRYRPSPTPPRATPTPDRHARTTSTARHDASRSSCHRPGAWSSCNCDAPAISAAPHRSTTPSSREFPARLPIAQIADGARRHPAAGEPCGRPAHASIPVRPDNEDPPRTRSAPPPPATVARQSASVRRNAPATPIQAQRQILAPATFESALSSNEVTWCSVTFDWLMLDCKTGAIGPCAVSPLQNQGSGQALRTTFTRAGRWHGTPSGQTCTKTARKGRDPVSAHIAMTRKNP